MPPPPGAFSHQWTPIRDGTRARLFRGKEDGQKSPRDRIVDVALTDVSVLVEGMGDGSLEGMEETLIAADFGVPATLKLVQAVETPAQRGMARSRRDFHRAVREDPGILSAGRADTALRFNFDDGPTVFLVVGVNGVGKTTTIARLAHRLIRQGGRWCWSRVTPSALEAMPPERRSWIALRHFRSERTLDLIERHVQRPVTEAWGMLAAQSCLSWERAARWLDLGRPLSLVALDGLHHCVARYTPYVHEQPPELTGPMPVDEMIDKLNAYARADPQHRPETTVKAIVQYLQGARHGAAAE